jgi:hypothetical protein
MTTNGVVCSETGSDIKAYGNLIQGALASGQIGRLMNLIPKKLVITDGSNYDVIRKKFSDVIGEVTQVNVTDIVLKEPALHRITISMVIKPDHHFVLYFDVFSKSGHFKIVDIYDEWDQRKKSSLKTLISYPSYEYESLPDFPGFVYMPASDADLTKLRTTYELDKIAGNGSEIEQIIRLMQWVHNTVPHDGNAKNPVPQNALNIIEVSKREKRGFNCRMLATVLNEACLSMGFSSRMITCLPADPNDVDCHVTNLVFSKTLGKWVYMDPSFEAYFMDKNGRYLDHAEIRKAIIEGNPLKVNDRLNHNGEPYGGGPADYIAYMTKNLIRLSSSLKSEFGAEDKYSFRVIELYPRGYGLCPELNRRAVGERFLCISNPGVFFAVPENNQQRQ